MTEQNEDDWMTVENCKSIAAYYQGKIDSITAECGTGVRPSWVSEEIFMSKLHRDHYLNIAKRLMEK